MSTLEMPERPHIDNFRRQARTLQRAVRAGDPEAIARVSLQGGAVPDDASSFQLSAAQSIVAREYGFASWPHLTRYLDSRAEQG
ncbi:hypothetical protein Rhe02_98520 [Rhizocola hellebori]|uniref:Uncharacterized protein n=1 Tax=Rhizocola hellebori TaxID=1392758 RepID=A0A8J3VMB0_9ACTN|nr:hypothetical protein [Rhizocola hellebori]GIH11785.1 hypothetical protein Rhe02_98520 [Rhizocola hellebori]